VSRPFIKGLDLSALVYGEVVAPILARDFPELRYSAALIGPGSEVLGFDTPQSMDHDWGPRLMLFLSEADHAAWSGAIDETLRRELPPEIHGYPTNFADNPDGTGEMAAAGGEPMNHRVRLLTIRGFCRDILGFDPAGSPVGSPVGEIPAADWVSVPANNLLMVTAGRVFHDGLGQLEPLRARLAYYPHDVWLYLLAAQWQRIDQEGAFMGRCGQVGDDLGSRVVASRLVRDLMHLCFLMERRYAPYIKWFGSAFAQLSCAPELAPVLAAVLDAKSWEQREQHLTVAYEAVAAMHNALGITEAVPAKVSPYWSRPFLVIRADRFVTALRAAITSEEVLALPEHLGSVDQFLDSTDALNHLDRFRALRLWG
jgi:hypothetical protein